MDDLEYSACQYCVGVVRKNDTVCHACGNAVVNIDWSEGSDPTAGFKLMDKIWKGLTEAAYNSKIPVPKVHIYLGTVEYNLIKTVAKDNDYIDLSSQTIFGEPVFCLDKEHHFAICEVHS